MPLLASLFVFGAIVLLVAWYIRSTNQLEDRVRGLSTHHLAMSQEDAPFSQRVMFPAIQGFTLKIVNVLPTSMVGRARKWLLISDSSMSLQTFISIVLVTSTALPVLAFAWIWTATNGSPSGLLLLLVPVLACVGLGAPLMILRRRAINRQSTFWKALPDSLDLLLTCVEAGLSLDFAFQRVAERQRGPVGDEMNRMLREKALGQTRREALLTMAERLDLSDVNVFVNSVIQAEALGTSIGQVLRIQSRQLRTRRRQHAEQAARRAAPKMVFPLVFFVMPSLFIVILGPIIINAFDTLNNR